jgi:hypothetical protein
MVASALVAYRNVDLVDTYSLEAVKCCLVLYAVYKCGCFNWTEADKLYVCGSGPNEYFFERELFL